MKRAIGIGAALLLLPLLVRLLIAQGPPPSQAPPPPPTYSLTDLGPMTVGAIDGQNVRGGPTALNANAQVVGFRTNSSFNGQFIGFLWQKGIFTDLGTGGGPTSFAYGINSTGQIVGASNFPGDLTGNSSRAFIWQNGVMTNLGADPNFWSRAYAINTDGDVAGFINNGPYLPVIWKGGTPAGKTMLASLPCSLANCQGEALAINDLGQVAGWSVGGSVNVARPVMWDSNGQPTDLIPNPGFYTEANGINNGGVVVGYYQPQAVSSSPIHAFAWQNGVLTDLGAVGNDTYSGAWGINSKGDTVGISATSANAILVGPGGGGRAFLYTGGIMYDLGSLLAPGTNWSLDTAFAINDSGQIVGTGVAPDLKEHGYLLTPIITTTTTAATSSANPSVFGQQVSFTATVTATQSSSVTPTGSVTFNDSSTGTVLGTVALSSGTAILNTAGLAVGSHTITASYVGDNNFGPSTSVAFNQTVNQAATITTLAVSPNPADVGQTVTLSAAVNVLAPGAGTPIGIVTFMDGTITLGAVTLNGAATAAFSTSSLASGSHSITATYGGDANFSGSTTSSSVTVTVQGPPPPVQITDNETIHVTDAESFLDVYDSEAVRVTDAVFVTPLIQVSAPVAEFSAGSLGFGGQSGSQTITVSDIGLASLTLTSATISGSSQFAVTQISCTNSGTSLATVLPSGGVCTVTIGYTASATPANDNGLLTFTDNAALSNLPTVASGSNYAQSIPLNGSGTTTPPPPPPPAVVPVIDNETISVTDTVSFPDVFDAEAVHVADAVFVTPLINVAAPVADYSAGSLGFGNVSPGQTGKQSIALSDIGQAPLAVSSAVTSPGSAFAISQIACSNGATFLPTTLPVGGACTFLISYTAPSGGASSGTLTFTDNTALSNVVSTPAGSSYTQSISLNGSGATTPPPPPPPAVVPIMDNETINVADLVSFPDVFDSEAVHVTDAVFVTPLINVAAPVVDYSAGSLGFGNVAAGQTGTQSLTLSDIGQAPLTVSSAVTSQGSAFTIAQVSCSNGATALPTTLPVGGVCTFLVSYTAPSGAAVNDVLTFTDNAALSNFPTVASGSRYTQSIVLNGSGTTPPPPPPPPAVVPIMDNETITVTDAVSFSDLFAPETVHVADAVLVTPLINVGAPVADYSPGSLGFGNVGAGQTGTQSLTLSDIGQAPLVLSSAVISQSSSAFAVSQIACSNGATSLPATLPVGGACTFLVSYAAPSGAASNDMVTFTDNAALSNVASTPAGSSYTQSISLNGSGTSTPPPPPPPAVVPVMDDETINVTDTTSFPDLYDSETITVSDQVTVKIISSPTTTSISAASVPYGTAASGIVSVSSPGGTVTGIVTLSVDGGAASSLVLTGGSATFDLRVLSAGNHNLVASFAAQGAFDASAASGTVTISQASSTVTVSCPATPQMYTGAVQTPCTAAYKTSDALSGALTVSYINNTNVGTAGVSASYAGDANHAGSSGTGSFTITQATSSVAVNCPAAPQAYTGAAQTPCTAGYKTSDGLSGALTVSYTNNTNVGMAGASASYAGDANHSVSSGTGSFTIIKANQTITLTGVPSSSNFGQGPFTLSASATSGLAVALSVTGSCSLSGNSLSLTGVGTCTVTATQPGNSNYNPAPTLSPTFAIGPTVTTTNVSVSSGTVQYSDYTTLNATVSPTSAAGQALTGTVQFYLNGKAVGSPVGINTSGVATLSQVQVNLAAGSYPVKAMFTSTNANFAGSNGTTSQIVTQENAFILYSGDTIAQVGTYLNLRATVWDSAAVGYPGVNPESGPTATIGDITKIWIAFDIYAAGSCGSGTPSTLYAQIALTGAAGIGTAATTLNSSSEFSYCVVSRLVAGSTGRTNLFYTAPNAQAAGLDFYMNSGQFATGGGWVNDPTGSHGNFGFNARYNSTGSPKGQIVYVYRVLYNGVPADFIIKSNALSALQFTGTTYPISSTLQGKANVQVNRASDGLSLFSAGNYTLSATVTDSGQNGVTGKQFSLSVYDSNGVPYHQVSLNTPLQGGNVVVHSH
jgi:probable HAF family extracellular repeat protein